MSWLLVILLSCLAAELLMRMPVLPAALLTIASCTQALRVIRAVRISDHWKEKAMPLYTLRTARHSLLLGAHMAIIAVIVSALAFGMERFVPDLRAALISPSGLLIGLGGSILYLALRPHGARA